MAIYDDVSSRRFTGAVLRVVSGDACDGIPLEVMFNDIPLSEFEGCGELFEPLLDIGLPRSDEVRFFRVPLDNIKTGDNTLCVEARDAQKPVEFIAVELALYVD